ncbi:nitroreductase family protein [Streptomyces sp. NPDC087300]|uniref:nitroreductase family protein n=1 Tax=Streptomyces sp. NPDC087300 TaxID=3365780 RepID=UPI00380C1B27
MLLAEGGDRTWEATRPGPAEGPSAAAFWDRMMLTAPARRAPSPRAAPAGLGPALRLLEAAWHGGRAGMPAAPSAGALHPYECLVVTGTGTGAAVFAADPVRRTCALLTEGPETGRALDESGLAVPEGGALLLVVARPWLSIRKYGDRGYLYTQLDAAHFAVHLLGLAADADERAALRTRLDTGPLAALLGLDRHCRFIHSVLTVGAGRGGRGPDAGHGTGTGPDTGRDGWSQTRGGAAFAPVSWLEQACWGLIGPFRERGRPADSEVVPEPLVSRASELLGGRPFASGESRTGLAARRRSAKTFTKGAVSRHDLGVVLSAMRAELRTDLPGGDPVRATLVARDVTGLGVGSIGLTGAGAGTGTGAAGPGLAPTAVTDEELVEICMGQDHLRHAAGFVLLHARRQELLRDGPSGIDRVLFRAGALGHLLYLGAAEAELSITAIGGFDSARWRAVADLAADEEVLYVLVIGTSAPDSDVSGVPGVSGAMKLDRLHVAYAQNER